MNVAVVWSCERFQKNILDVKPNSKFLLQCKGYVSKTYSGRRVKRPESCKKKPQQMNDKLFIPCKQKEDERYRIEK